MCAVQIRHRVSVSGIHVTVYSAVCSMYGKFRVYRPNRHCCGDFSGTPVHLYRTCIIPVLFYRCETWTITKTLAVSQCLQSRVCRKSSEYHTPSRLQTGVWIFCGCSPVSENVKCYWLRFFGQLAHLAPEEHHHTILLPLHFSHHLTGGDAWDAQEASG